MLITMLKIGTRARRRAPGPRRPGRTRVLDVSGPMSSTYRTTASDLPWIGWKEPRHDLIVRPDRRSSTFERDLQKVLDIFAD